MVRRQCGNDIDVAAELGDHKLMSSAAIDQNRADEVTVPQVAELPQQTQGHQLDGLSRRGGVSVDICRMVKPLSLLTAHRGTCRRIRASVVRFIVWRLHAFGGFNFMCAMCPRGLTRHMWDVYVHGPCDGAR